MLTTFTVRLPGDLFDSIEDFAHYAIYYAKEEMASDYVVPANWRAERVSGDIGDNVIEFRVTRETN